MANTDAAFGLRPIRHLNGMNWNGMTMRCWVDSTYATAIYLGAAVTLVASLDETGIAPTVQAATAGDGNKVFGVFTSRYSPIQSDEVYHPASVGEYVNVCVDPTVIYLVQSSGIMAYTEIGQNISLASNGGSATTGLSTGEIGTAAAVDASQQLFILAFHDDPENDISAANGKWEVLLNMHWLRTNTTAVGVLGVSA